MGDVRGVGGRRGDGIVDIQRALDEPARVERAQANLRASTESSATKARGVALRPTSAEVAWQPPGSPKASPRTSGGLFAELGSGGGVGARKGTPGRVPMTPRRGPGAAAQGPPPESLPALRRALCGGSDEVEDGVAAGGGGFGGGGGGGRGNDEVKGMLSELHRRSSKLEDALMGMLSEMRDIKEVAYHLEERLGGRTG